MGAPAQERRTDLANARDSGSAGSVFTVRISRKNGRHFCLPSAVSVLPVDEHYLQKTSRFHNNLIAHILDVAAHPRPAFGLLCGPH